MRKILAALLLLFTTLITTAQWKGLAPFTAYAAAGDVQLFHTRDLTGDGLPDLTVLYSASHTSFGLLPGRGDGTLAALQTKAKETNYFLSDIADLNSDGAPDMVLSSYWNNGFKVFFGEGGGRLREGPFLPTGMHARAVMCADMNRDGIMDVVGASSGSGRPIYLHVFLGRGDGSFAERQSTASVLDTSKDILLTDKNGDGLPDVVVSSSFPWVVLFVQKEDGSFEPQYYPTWTTARVALADVNRDSREDLLLLYSSYDNTPGSDSLVVRLNTGGTEFGEGYKVDLGAQHLRPSRLLVHDLNRDGYQDLVLNQHDLEGEPTDTLYYLLGREGARFAAAQYWQAPAPVLYADWADLDSDGWSDLVVSCKGGSVHIALNKGAAKQDSSLPFLVYPNPARGWLYVQGEMHAAYSIRLYSATGQLVKETASGSGKTGVPVQHLPGGLYYVVVISAGTRKVQPVLILP